MHLLTPEMLTLHEDAFSEFFRPYRHPQASCDIWGGIGLETFGEDLELVKSLPVESVWTMAMTAYRMLKLLTMVNMKLNNAPAWIFSAPWHYFIPWGGKNLCALTGGKQDA